MKEKEMMTGVPINILTMMGHAMFHAQKIELKLKRVIFIRHEMGYSKTFDKDRSKIKRLALEGIIQEVKKYGVFTDKGIELLEYLKDNRNYVSHECFDGLGVDELEDKNKEMEIFEELRDMSQKFFKAYDDVWHIWKKHENDYEFFKMTKEGQ
ncbi:MAG: hypothetical protein FWE16_02245 [Firmicutes bacterium]|nr:hypothetical protein [Bacillota bacterium]